MSCARKWDFGYSQRCGKGRGIQQVPGNTSYRQEWPLNLCDETECETEAETVETGRTSSRETIDKCRDEELKKTEAAPGPLERFDASVRRLLEGDIWSREVQTHRQEVLPGVLKKAAAGVSSSTEPFVSNESEVRSYVKRLTAIERSFQFEQALRKAEEASASAPDEKIEEIALASARGFTMSMDTEREATVSSDGRTVVEVISYCGVTKPLPENVDSA